MLPIRNVEILDILNPRSTSDLFLIKDTSTGGLFVWRKILLGNIPKDKKEALCNKIRYRVQQEHVLLVKFYPVIEDEKLKLIYVPMEFFPRGNFFGFIEKLQKTSTTHINEVIVVKMLFQLLILMKSIKVCGYLSLHNIYFDEDFNVKFLNFSQLVLTKLNIRMCDIGSLFMKICMLHTTEECNNYLLNKDYYSSEFIDLITFMLEDKRDVNENIDKLIGHPAILLNTFKLNCGLKLDGCFEIMDYRCKLEGLRKKEATLKSKEHKIERKEHSLNVRERKISISEKTVKDKLTQAELYLKRCKENKSNQIHKYEHINLSAEYEEIECSDIIETSKKLNIEKLEKPLFIRTFSERKVRFKGHSPLKEMDFRRGKSVKKSKTRNVLFKEHTMEKQKEFPKGINSTSEDISNIDESISKPFLKHGDKNRHIIFGPKSKNGHYENINLDCRPIIWTDENKRQAFDLLKIMNSTTDKQVSTGDVKHTYL